MILFKGNHISVEWDEKNKLLYYGIYGFATGDLLREEVLHYLEAVRQTQAKKVLIDATQRKIVSKEDQEWANNYLVDRLIELGMRYQAILIPTSALAQQSFKDMVAHAKTLETRYFVDKDAALAWLNSEE
jgi:hypothetical protein